MISIHAPRAGSDSSPGKATAPPTDFNPRSPCGERRRLFGADFRAKRFQSTLPVRGATHVLQLHAHYTPNFNPRSPCGERLG